MEPIPVIQGKLIQAIDSLAILPTDGKEHSEQLRKNTIKIIKEAINLLDEHKYI